jgi:ferredoxin
VDLPRIDLDACQGHGRCHNLAPAVFRPTDDVGRAEVIPGVEITDRDRPAVDRAVAACPEMAIDWSTEPTP